MNKFKAFVKARPFGFITDTDLPELIRLHRLCMCMVRLRGPGGRFVAPAQNVAQLVKYCEQCGDSVRDVSITSQELANADKWQEELNFEQTICPVQKPVDVSRVPANRRFFNELIAECGGAVDAMGNVTSDADPGL